jgi:ABC-2 type transport system ATP-binding protein
MTKAITVKNLVKRYKKADKNSVDDISFEVNEGQLFAFLGPNGAGKTTTISILTTTLSKTSGEVNIAGFDLDKNQREIRRNIGIIFQNPSLDLNLTAEENVRIHAAMYGAYPFAPTFGMMPQGYKDKFMELAQLLGIKDDMNKPVKAFSGGMKRKLEIMRSLTHSPRILFLDEPTTGLDPISRRSVWEYLAHMRKTEKITVFLTTHYLDEAENADNVTIMNKGRIMMSDTVSNIKERLKSDYILLSAQNPDNLIKELDKSKIGYSMEADKIRIKIEDPKTIQPLIQKIKSPLQNIEIFQPTLEQAYIRIIEN